MDMKKEVMKEREFSSWFEVLMCTALTTIIFGTLLIVALITYR